MMDLAQHFLGLPVFIRDYQDLCLSEEEKYTFPVDKPASVAQQLSEKDISEKQTLLASSSRNGQ